ncbi:MAG: GTPase Era [Syntrophomonadaceae bacterium]|nr:GTPase Era [Syntrophomonadaceae bacterium]
MAVKSGFVSIIGRPNVGKSTFLNTVVGQKVAIVSSKPQTTRNRIQGIYSSEAGQIIFIDTPGLHKPRHKLGEYMVGVAQATVRDADLILYMVDASSEIGRGEEYILELLRDVPMPVFLVLNKIDLVDQDVVEQRIAQYQARMRFAEVVPISAIRGTNVQTLIEKVFAALPEGPFYYPPEEVTDQPERFIVAELIREKALQLTREEVPHSLAVEIEEMQERRPDLTYVRAVIYCERESQKGIIIGRGGAMLKSIGEAARQDIEDLLGIHTYLELWVKVKKDWRNQEAALKGLGYR